MKIESQKQIKFCLFKYYTVDLFEQEFSKLDFPNYQEIISVIDKVASIEGRWIIQNSKKWFNGEIANEIKNRDKLSNAARNINTKNNFKQKESIL